MRVVPVSLGDRSYRILIGHGLMDRLGRECRALGLGTRCAVITDRNVAPRFAQRCLASLKAGGFDPVLITLPAGETAKNWRTVADCHDQLAAHRLERRSFVVALGGGVMGDLAGFVAATYLRGIALVQVPTTLLSQVDSSVGGKVGVNLKAGKNLVGAFHQPKLVLCDLDTLATLPEREFKAGLAEVIKYGIICDRRMFGTLERHSDKVLARDPRLLTELVGNSCMIKGAVVEEDETEGGLRKMLNFGHTIGHAIEAISKYGKYVHGEAISIGQTAAAELSARLTGLPAKDARRIADLFAAMGLPNTIRLTPAETKRLFAAMKLDKKTSGGEIKFVLAQRIGRVVWDQKVPDALIGEVLAGLAGKHTH